MFYKLNVLNAKTPLRRIAPTSSKSGRADALGECASTRTVIPSTVRGETTMLDLDQAIRERHSTRLFLSQPVPRELVNEALALAQYAPSNSNIQPWHMVLASGASRDRLVAALIDEAQRRPPNIPPLPASFQHFR